MNSMRAGGPKRLRYCPVEVGGCTICSSLTLEGSVGETVVEEEDSTIFAFITSYTTEVSMSRGGIEAS